MQMKKLPRKKSSREESFSQAISTLFLFYLQLHYAYRNIVTKRMDCCNSAVSALKEQLFFSGMQCVKREMCFQWIPPSMDLRTPPEAAPITPPRFSFMKTYFHF
jgi:hypothetical protein